MIDLPPLPVCEYEHNDGFGLPVAAAYTITQMRQYGEACYRAALEAAAQRFDVNRAISGEWEDFARGVAAELRELARPAPPPTN